MILEHLYRVSLEEPHRWAMWFGPPMETGRMLDARIDMLRAYIHGLREGVALSGSGASDWDDFSAWLMTHGHFPTEGWPQKLLRKADGDHIRAIGRFWGLLHEYVLDTRPVWFVRLNSEPLPSRICNVNGPLRQDIRLPDHVRAAAGSHRPPRPYVAPGVYPG
jgi:hypothetical protein